MPSPVNAATERRYHPVSLATPSQPHLYYQLDELVYLGWRHNMQVPLLALDALREFEDSFYTSMSSDIEEETRKRRHEVDVNCVTDGLLTMGRRRKITV